MVLNFIEGINKLQIYILLDICPAHNSININPLNSLYPTHIYKLTISQKINTSQHTQLPNNFLAFKSQTQSHGTQFANTNHIPLTREIKIPFCGKINCLLLFNPHNTLRGTHNAKCTQSNYTFGQFNLVLQWNVVDA